MQGRRQQVRGLCDWVLQRCLWGFWGMDEHWSLIGDLAVVEQLAKIALTDSLHQIAIIGVTRKSA
jgi:hypothetical protein